MIVCREIKQSTSKTVLSPITVTLVSTYSSKKLCYFHTTLEFPQCLQDAIMVVLHHHNPIMPKQSSCSLPVILIGLIFLYGGGKQFWSMPACSMGTVPSMWYLPYKKISNVAMWHKWVPAVIRFYD